MTQEMEIHVKIISGIFRNRNFYSHISIRPTQGVVRKAVFDILGEEIEGKSFLDLFAGSGAMALEALSRGAGEVIMIEKDPKVCEVIYENINLLVAKMGTHTTGTCPQIGKIEVIQDNGMMMIKNFAKQGRTFDFVFVDPPYGRQTAKKALKTLGAYDILHTNSSRKNEDTPLRDSLIIIQADRTQRLPETEGLLTLLRQKDYGNTRLSIYRKSLG